MERIGACEGPLTDQPLNANFSFLLHPKGCVIQNFKNHPGSQGSREEILLVVAAQEHVDFVLPEGGSVVVRDGGGEGVGHHVGDVERGEDPRGPGLRATLVFLSLKESDV